VPENVPEIPMVRTPDWAKHAIWYQVMVERFRDGDPSNDPDPAMPWTADWYEAAPWEGRDGQTFYEHFIFDRHYGGDLQGLREQLPYLESLGVNAIYLNPIFQASTHTSTTRPTTDMSTNISAPAPRTSRTPSPASDSTIRPLGPGRKAISSSSISCGRRSAEGSE
jgi:hypothetical protein